MVLFLIFTAVFVGLIFATAKKAKGYMNPQLRKMIFRDVWVTLETLDIIENSTSIETVHRRFPVLFQALKSLIGLGKKPLFAQIVREAEEQFRIDYYDRVLKPEWIQVLYQPEFILNEWASFCDKSLSACFTRYAGQQRERILELKTQKGKLNRTDKIIEELETLVSLSLSDELRKASESALASFRVLRDSLSQRGNLK